MDFVLMINYQSVCAEDKLGRHPEGGATSATVALEVNWRDIITST